MADSYRQHYAEGLVFASDLTCPLLYRALSLVPREDYLPPGPWRYAIEGGGYRGTPTDHPRHLYHDVFIAIDEARKLNNGLPSYVAKIIEAAGIREGEHITHVGAGTGYYTALMAEMVGPEGAVSAYEVDPVLCQRAASNLDHFNLGEPELVQVSGRDGFAEHQCGDVTFASCGVTHLPPWLLDDMKPGDRVIVPITTTQRGELPQGQYWRITRQAEGVSAVPIANVTVYNSASYRDPELDALIAVGKLLLRTDPHEQDETCKRHHPLLCMSTGHPIFPGSNSVPYDKSHGGGS